MMTVMTLSAFRYFSTLRYFSAFRYFSTPRYFCYAIVFNFMTILRYCDDYYQIRVMVRCVSLAKMGAAVTVFFECVIFCPSELFSFIPPSPRDPQRSPFSPFSPANIAVTRFPQSRLLWGEQFFPFRSFPASRLPDTVLFLFPLPQRCALGVFFSPPSNFSPSNFSLKREMDGFCSIYVMSGSGYFYWIWFAGNRSSGSQCFMWSNFIKISWFIDVFRVSCWDFYRNSRFIFAPCLFYLRKFCSKSWLGPILKWANNVGRFLTVKMCARIRSYFSWFSRRVICL